MAGDDAHFTNATSTASAIDAVAFVEFVRELYQTDTFIPLHEPRFNGHEKKYVCDAIDSTFVSSVGAFVDRFEREIADYCGCRYAVATVNGTAALHTALHLSGVTSESHVLTQSLSFVATCNAIDYCSAEGIFIDVDRHTLGLSPQHLKQFLNDNVSLSEGHATYKKTGKPIRACVPMHTFGFPSDTQAIASICENYGIPVIEDAAEALGSSRNGQAIGTHGLLGCLSFNGNKIMTTGGGGMLLCNDEAMAKRAKFITTTAKTPHPWHYSHDEVAFNYRMPNLNAALGCAQLEQLSLFIEKKRALAQQYQAWSRNRSLTFISEPTGTQANYWLNAFLLENTASRDVFLQYTNDKGVMTRPLWQPMHTLRPFAHWHRGTLSNTDYLAAHVVNVPSSVPHCSPESPHEGGR